MLTNNTYEPFLEEVFKKYSINTKLRKAHFLAQLKHESGNFTIVQESFNYKTVDRLFKVFTKYFDTNKNKRMDLTELQILKTYLGKPEKLASYVYANRMGNGNFQSGDGWKYRGKGLIQLTGKDTQTSYAQSVSINISKDPDFLTQPHYAIDSAGWFWDKNNLNALADEDEFTKITVKINGGKNGIDERLSNLGYYKKLLTK